VLAIDEPQLMAQIKIAWVKAAPRGGVGVHTGIPFPTLHEHCRVRDQRVAADVIEMKVRVDDEVDLAGISVNRFEPGADLLAGLKADTEEPGKARAEPPSGVVLAIGVQPCVEQCPPLRVLDQKDRDRHGEVAFAAFHQMGELAGHRAASEGIQLDCHSGARPLIIRN
jgi:hypothetical protein